MLIYCAQCAGRVSKFTGKCRCGRATNRRRRRAWAIAVALAAAIGLAALILGLLLARS